MSFCLKTFIFETFIHSFENIRPPSGEQIYLFSRVICKNDREAEKNPRK
jgi:hypothetical protein